MLELLILIVITTAIWAFFRVNSDRLRRYKDDLGLKKANLVYANNYQKIKSLILLARRTVFSKIEPVIWLYVTSNGTELFLGSNYTSDVRIWLESKLVLKDVHIVLDSKSNNPAFSNLRHDKLPKQRVALEGNFSNHFNLYCNEGQQIVALQIIAPDIMLYLLDNLLNADIEIIDNQIALIIKDGAKTLERLKSSIELAYRISNLARAATKVTML